MSKRSRSSSKSQVRIKKIRRGRRRSQSRSSSRQRMDYGESSRPTGYTQRGFEVVQNPDLVQLCDDAIKNFTKKFEKLKNDLKKTNFDDMTNGEICHFKDKLPWSKYHGGEDIFFDFGQLDEMWDLDRDIDQKLEKYGDIEC